MILLLYVIVHSLWSIKHKGSTVYPEGTKLLKDWKAQELRESLKEENQNTNETKPSILDEIKSEPTETEQNQDLKGGFVIDPEAFE